MTKNETQLIAKLAKKEDWQDYEVTRRSEREYDLSIEGKYGKNNKYLSGTFSAWLVLAAIRELTLWTSPEIASMTDHPDMCEEGDWSGMRDSNPEALWAIFNHFVKPC